MPHEICRCRTFGILGTPFPILTRGADVAWLRPTALRFGRDELSVCTRMAANRSSDTEGAAKVPGITWSYRTQVFDSGSASHSRSKFDDGNRSRKSCLCHAS